MGVDSGQPSRPMMQKAHFYKNWDSQTTTNSYVDLGTVWDKTGFDKTAIQVWNTGDTNDISYKILGSLNGTDYDIDIVSPTILGEDDYDLIDISSIIDTYIPFIKIQVESTIDDSHSTVKAYGVCI